MPQLLYCEFVSILLILGNNSPLMKLADTHAHLYLPEFNDDRKEVVERSLAAGVDKILLPNINGDSLRPMLDLCADFPKNCFPMIGLHPTSVNTGYEEALGTLFATVETHQFVAVGEVGIDLYWDKTYLKEQLEALERQIEFALINDLPVAIHTRDAMAEIFDMLESFRGRGPRGVLHAFSGDPSDARKAVDAGFMVGIGGPVTYKKSTQAEVVKYIGTEHIVLETDSPYLSPVPFRGKRNESSYIRAINEKVASILGISPEDTALITYHNSCKLFGLEC